MGKRFLSYLLSAALTVTSLTAADVYAFNDTAAGEAETGVRVETDPAVPDGVITPDAGGADSRDMQEKSGVQNDAKEEAGVQNDAQEKSGVQDDAQEEAGAKYDAQEEAGAKYDAQEEAGVQVASDMLHGAETAISRDGLEPGTEDDTDVTFTDPDTGAVYEQSTDGEGTDSRFSFEMDVLSNLREGDPDDDSKRFDPDGEYVIGRAAFDRNRREVRFLSIRSSSENPNESDVLKVPRRIVVTDLDGTLDHQVALDYTNGYYVDSEGYALTKQGGVEDDDYKKVVVDYVLDPDTDAEVPVYGPFRLGDIYDVTELDEEVFRRDEQLTRSTVTDIEIPSTIDNDITYRFFTGLNNVKTINVYEVQSYDHYRSDGSEIESFRYVSKGGSSGSAGGENRIYTAGVLVDTRPAESGVLSEIIYCPPRREDQIYNFYYGTARNSLTIIGPHAFENCRNLITIEPAARSSSGIVAYDIQVIKEIGESAFKGCTSLETPMVFSDTLTDVGDEAFSGCTSLSEVTLRPTPGRDTRLGRSVFAKTAIEKLQIPVGYRYVTGESFRDMDSLRTIDVVAGIPANDEEINRYLYSEDGVLYRYSKGGEEEPDPLEGLELVRYPSQCTTSSECPDQGSGLLPKNSFMVPYYTTAFDEYCFYKCEAVTNMYFPSTITRIGLNRFYRCKGLENLYFYSGLPDLGEDVAPADYGSVNFFGLADSADYRYMKIFAGTGTPIYEYAAANQKSVYQMEPNSLYNTESFEFRRNSSGEATVIGYTPPANELVEHLVVPNYVETDGKRYRVVGIASGAIADGDIKSVYLLHDMRDVATDAFYRVVNPEDYDDAENINSGNLSIIKVEPGNNNLASIDGVLYTLTYNEDTKQYEPRELLYYPVGSTQEEYTCAEGISVLPRYAFWGATNLRKVNIYDTVQEIGYDAESFEADEPLSFAGCSQLVMVNILHSDRVSYSRIRYYSDQGVLYTWNPNGGTGGSGCPAVLVYYPEGRRDMDRDALTPISYTVADGCTEVRCMKNCPFLGGVVFPKSVTRISEEAFSGSRALSSAEFLTTGEGEGIKYIDRRAFAETDIISLRLPGTIRAISEEAFFDCNMLTDVAIEGDSITEIGERAFYRSRGSYNSSRLKEVRIFCNKLNETGGNLCIRDDAFRANGNLKSLFITNMGNVEICDGAFRDSATLTELDLSNTSLTAVWSNAFRGCSSLAELDLTDMKKLTSVSEYSFYGCTSLMDVMLPANVESIGALAFKNCNSLQSVNFEDLKVLTRIERQAFANTHFITVILPPNLKTMGDSVFINDDSSFKSLLSTIYVPDSLDLVDDLGNIDEREGKGPFYSYGEDTFIYGTNGCETDIYIQKLWAYRSREGLDFPIPTFVGADAMPVAGVNLVQSEVDVFDVGDNFPLLTAIVSSQDDLRDYSVSWYVIDPAVCYIADIKYDGLSTSTCRVHGLATGTTRIYAVNRQTGASDYCVINVKSAGIEVNPTDSNLQTVDGMTLPKSIILNSKGANTKTELNAVSVPARKIYYRSNNKGVARVNRAGVVSGKKAGSTTIVAYAGEGETYVEAEVEVTVYKPWTRLDKKKIKLNSAGSEENMISYLTAAHDGAYSEVTWESSNTRVCTVEAEGDIALVRALRPGKAVVTATCNGIRAKSRVTVYAAGVTLNTSSIMLYAGSTRAETFQLKAVGTGLSKKVTYTSADPDIATVDDKGLVTAKSEGTTVVTATCNGVPVSCSVRVVESYIKILGGEAGDTNDEKKEIVINSRGANTYQLNARVVGREETVTWKSTSPNLFTVSKEGLVTGRMGGSAYVTAEANGDEAECTVIVIDNYTELDYSNTINLYLSGLPTERNITLTATIEGADPRKEVIWEVEDPSVVFLGANSGRADMEQTEHGGKSQCTVKALKEGETVVRVTANGVTDECRIKVLNR